MLQLSARLAKASLIMLFATLLMVSQMASAALAEIPALTSRVTDTTQTLSSEQKTALEAKLQVFEQKKGSQIAVLIVPTTQPEDIAQYAIRVVEKWKIGREKSDDGLLVLLAKDDRKMRIEVGYGLEGTIPDLTAKRVISEVMAPRFKQGDFAGGIDAGLDKLIGLVDGEALPAPATPAAGGMDIGNLLPLLLFGGLVSGLFLRSIFGTFFGSTLNGGLIGGVVMLLGTAVFGAAILGVIAFFITMMLGARGINGYGTGYPGGYGGGGLGGGGFGSNSSWGGGGGGFGGGGASGDW